MTTVDLTLDEIHDLAHGAMTANGCNEANAAALADIVTRAERDGSHSHGLFRIPGYVKALRSGKVDGAATPTVTRRTPAVIQCEGHGCFAPLAQATALPVLAEAAQEIGVAALSLTGIHHFAALWPETEFLADRGLVGIACTASDNCTCPPGEGLEAGDGGELGRVPARDGVEARVAGVGYAPPGDVGVRSVQAGHGDVRRGLGVWRGFAAGFAVLEKESRQGDASRAGGQGGLRRRGRIRGRGCE